MKQSPEKSQASKGRTGADSSREERLKAALKANMARRKAQAKARAQEADTEQKDA